MTKPVSKVVFATLERSLFAGRWETVEELVQETGFHDDTVRAGLQLHPLADWRPAACDGRGAPVKEWCLMVPKAKRRKGK